MASQLAFYRTKSALQVDTIPATHETINSNNGEMVVLKKHGALLLQGAIGENRNFNWREKVNFAISVNDYPAVLDALCRVKINGLIDLKLLHDKNAGKDDSGKDTVTMSIKNGNNKGTYFLSLFHGEKKISVSMSFGDLLLFEEVLKAFVPYMIGMRV